MPIERQLHACELARLDRLHPLAERGFEESPILRVASFSRGNLLFNFDASNFIIRGKLQRRLGVLGAWNEVIIITVMAITGLDT